MSYTALVVSLDSYYQNFHAPEDLGLYKALSKFTTIAAVYLLDYTLPLVAKLSKSLQTRQLDLSMISSLVDAVLHDWMIPLLQQHIGFWNFWIPRMTFSKRPEKLLVQTRSTHSRKQWGHHLEPSLKENISSWLATHDFVSALAIFDPRNVPSTDSSQFPTYGKKSSEVLLNHYGNDKFALILK